MAVVTQSEFARLQGWSKGYVTQLKQAGRLVMTDDGRVDVEASQARIMDTRDPNRDDVAARHAAARSDDSPKPPSQPLSAPSKSGGGLNLGGEIYDFQTARAIKESYLAAQAKIDYEERTGRLVDAEAVSMKQYELARQVRDSMMAIPSRISEQLAAEADPAAVDRMLTEEIRQALETAAKLAGEMDDELTEAVG